MEEKKDEKKIVMTLGGRERFVVYMKREAMVALKKYCLDKGKKLSSVLEEIALDKVKKG